MTQVRLPVGAEVRFAAAVINRTSHDPSVASARGHVVEVRGKLRRVDFDGSSRPRLVPARNLELHHRDATGLSVEYLWRRGWVMRCAGEDRPINPTSLLGWLAAAQVTQPRPADSRDAYFGGNV